jgi:3-oxoacyl-[acyl-carrier-protein] synthase-3
MVGIKAIGTYLPKGRISNLDRAAVFDTDENFIIEKIGIKSVSVKDEEDNTSDMSVKAFFDLDNQISLDKTLIDVVILVTQNPDANIPHTSAVIHGLLELSEDCAVFDISLGCSGFVYGLSVIKAFMEANGFRHGLLFTCDPYSKILDPKDKNTSLLFGDGATVTYLTENPVYSIGNATFGTIGKERHNLTCNRDHLYMNGRGIFNFAARYVPKDVEKVLLKNNLEKKNIDKFIFHQGSKYILDTLIKRIELDPEKVVNDIFEYGNTVSSSIPMILKQYLNSNADNNILISGFGVGLSWSSNILTLVKK